MAVSFDEASILEVVTRTVHQMFSSGALTAHDAADAELDAILAEYRGSDAKAAHDRQEAAGLAMLAMMGKDALNDYLYGEVDCDSV